MLGSREPVSHHARYDIATIELPSLCQLYPYNQGTRADATATYLSSCILPSPRPEWLPKGTSETQQALHALTGHTGEIQHSDGRLALRREAGLAVNLCQASRGDIPTTTTIDNSIMAAPTNVLALARRPQHDILIGYSFVCQGGNI